MVRNWLIACAALVCASGVHATPIETKIAMLANGTTYYFKNDSVRPLDFAPRPRAIQFWVRIDNPPGQAIRQWTMRIYLDCATTEYLSSYVIGTDANGKVLQSSIWGAAQKTWTAGDPTVAAFAKAACPGG